MAITRLGRITLAGLALFVIGAFPWLVGHRTYKPDGSCYYRLGDNPEILSWPARSGGGCDLADIPGQKLPNPATIN